MNSNKRHTRLLAKLLALNNSDFDIIKALRNLSADIELVNVPPVTESTCELCGKQRECVTHHWTDYFGFHTKSVCRSCNVSLGVIFCGNCPTWEEQVKAINNQLEKVR